MPSSIRREIGQLLIGSLPGTTIPPDMRSLAREFGLGGVILFARNIEEPEQVAELAYDVQSLAAGLPLWVSVDQEGGRVARLKAPFTVWPPMAALGRSEDVRVSSQSGPVTSTIVRRLEKYIGKSQFRPLLVNGERAARNDVALRYYFRY